MENKGPNEQCPMCYTDLRGSPVPDTDPPEYYTNLIHVEIPWLYDGTLFYECPFCDARFHRFRPGTDRWRKADPYVRRTTEPSPVRPPEPPSTYQLEDGTVLTNVHHPSLCAGETCSIHRPSQHRMYDFPRTWEYGVVCRICPHGVIHPDPDAMAWRSRVTGALVLGLHECCESFCCAISPTVPAIES